MEPFSRVVNTVIEAVGIRRYTYILLITGIVYFLILGLFPVLNFQSAALSAVPVVMAAWYFKLWGGLTMVLFVIPLNTLFYNLIDGSSSYIWGRVGISSLMLVLMGVATAYVRQRCDHRQEQIDHYRHIAEDLEHSEVRYRTLIENTGDFVARFDRQLRHLYVNPALLSSVGLTLDDYLGKTNEELNMPEDEVRLWNAHITRVFETGKEDSFEFNFETVHGLRYFESRLFPENMHAGKPETVISVVRDVTLRKQVEAQQLQPMLENERVRALSQFVTHISHDIRTPLSIIKTSSYLAERTDSETRRQSHFEKIDASVDHITRVIEAIATIAKLDMNDPFIYGSLDVETFGTGLVGRFQSIAEEKDVRFVFECTPQPRLIRADGDYLGQAISNLIYNAIWHCRSGEEVTLRIWQDEKFTYIEVRDHGNGINEEDLPLIFERFYRSDQARTINEFTGGTGLGLAITKEIIKRHTGTIEVDNTPGIGCSFRVMLPDDPQISS